MYVILILILFCFLQAQFREKEPKPDANQNDNANTKLDKKKVQKKLQQLEKYVIIIFYTKGKDFICY